MMQNSTIIEKIDLLSSADDIDYDELVDALCNPMLYNLLSEVLSTLMLNALPEVYVETIYFYYQGNSPLSQHALLPELKMKSLSGECYARILHANRKSTKKYPNICKDLFIRYWFTYSFHKECSSLTRYTHFDPFTIDEIMPYLTYITNGLSIYDFSKLVSYGKFTIESFRYLLNTVFIKELNNEISTYLMNKIYTSTIMSETEKEEYCVILIRMNNKHNLLYGGNDEN